MSFLPGAVGLLTRSGRRGAALPTFDFTQGSLPAGVTYAGNGGLGTRINSSGLIVPSIADQPRFDHDPVTLAPLGILLEPAATNRLLQSANVGGGGSWSLSGLTRTIDDAAAPDGTTSADKLIETATTAAHQVVSGTTIPTVLGENVTVSLFVKKGAARYIQCILQTASMGAAQYAHFDNINGAVVAQAIGTGSVQDWGGYWRLIFTCPATATSTTFVAWALVPTSGSARGASYLGSTSEAIHAWGGQGEAGTKASSFIPTVGSAVTRTADVMTVTALAEGTYRLTFGDDTTADVVHAGGDYAVPTGAGRRLKTLAAVA